MYKKLLGPKESDLTDAPHFELRDPETEEGVQGFLEDLQKNAFGQIKCKAIDEIFLTKLRNIFKGPKTADAYKALGVRRIQGGRLRAASDKFMQSADPSIEFLKPVVEQLMPKMKTFASRLVPNWTPEMFNVKVAIFYYPPANFRTAEIPYLNWHPDGSIFSFGTADRPGLNIIRPAKDPFSYELSHGAIAFTVKPEKQTLLGWGGKGLAKTEAYKGANPTYHSVWHKDMAKEGRLSVTFGVYPAEK